MCDRLRTAVVQFSFLLLSLAVAAAAAGPGARLQPGDHVAVIGDSITEQWLYSKYIEDYLLMCRPETDLGVTQFGWSGETAAAFAVRMANDCLRLKPTVCTTCYGMNDGGYGPMDAAKGERYREAQKAIVKQMKAAGVRFIVLGSPGCVDSDTFGNDPRQAEMYNHTLAALRDIAREVAHEEDVTFADVHDAMITAMGKAKARYGPKYHVCGGDGIHPDCNGHLIMAYAFLRALGCDGHIGTITVDLEANKAGATVGHRVLSCTGGVVELESTRYPFCFYGDPGQPSATAGIIEFFPFNEELNRYLLVVKNSGAEEVKVTWGQASKNFTAEQLARGVNLAAEFLDNPFSAPFAEVEQKIAKKQAMERGLIQIALHNLPQYHELVPNQKEALDGIAAALVQKDKEARDALAVAVQPVKHSLRLEAVK